LNHYYINPIDPKGHLFEVTLRIEKPHPDGQELWLPNWIPGSYLIRDFSKHIIGVYAEHDGRAIKLDQISKNRWRLEPCDHAVQVSYQVYAFDLSVRSAYLDELQGFFNNTSLCLAVAGQEQNPCRLTLEPSDSVAHWRIATGMPRVSGNAHSWGEFEAENYDKLIDYPFLLGDLTIEEFIAHGIKHSLVLSGRHKADTSRITADLARICEYQLKMFGEPAPFKHYTFLTMVVGDGFGGLEHNNSTALVCSRKDLIKPGQTKVDDNYETFLSLCCHEYFHSWNIKTLKPKAFIPYPLEQETYTEQLWFYEGMTSYFDDYLLHRAGIISADRYLRLLGNTLARVERGVGQHQQSVTESSFLAWTKFYQQNENAPNSIVSYYAKGALIALCLDLTIRLQSDHQLDLQQIMHDFWHRYGKTGEGTEDHTFFEYLSHYTALDVNEMLHNALYSREQLPVSELLENFGVKVARHVPANDLQSNGKLPEKSAKVTLGARYKNHPQGLELTQVYHDESAYEAGLSANDRIIAIDHLQVTSDNINEILDAFKPGDSVTVHAFRRDELRTLKLTWQAPKKTSYVLSITQPEHLNNWLKTSP
tara:strand:+ start:2325 stop:4100 length:1776 start_codon:yes stop_codon:yes gene_type:complete